MKASVTRTELLLFWPETVKYAFEVQSVLLDFQRGEALLGQLHGALDVVERHQGGAGLGNGLLEVGVARGVEAVGRLGPAVARLHDRVEVPVEQPRPGDQGRHLLLLDRLPVDELLDIRVIEIENDHLRGAARGPP
jgi:hypothetical protein